MKIKTSKLTIFFFYHQYYYNFRYLIFHYHLAEVSKLIPLGCVILMCLGKQKHMKTFQHGVFRKSWVSSASCCSHSNRPKVARDIKEFVLVCGKEGRDGISCRLASKFWYFCVHYQCLDYKGISSYWHFNMNSRNRIWVLKLNSTFKHNRRKQISESRLIEERG